MNTNNIDNLLKEAEKAIEIVPLALCHNCAEVRIGYADNKRSDLLPLLFAEKWAFKEVPNGENRSYKWLCPECKEFFATTPLPVKDYD